MKALSFIYIFFYKRKKVHPCYLRYDRDSSERCLEGWQFPLCEPVENEIKYACDFFFSSFFFLFKDVYNHIGKSFLVIDESTKQKLSC